MLDNVEIPVYEAEDVNGMVIIYAYYLQTLPNILRMYINNNNEGR